MLALQCGVVDFARRELLASHSAETEMDRAAVLLLLALVAVLLWYPLLLPALPPSPPALFIWIPVLMLLLLFALAFSPAAPR